MSDLVKAFGGMSLEFAVLLKKIECEPHGFNLLADILEITEEVKELKLSSN